jgi:hypothetical protein
MNSIKALYVYEPVVLKITKVLTAMSGPHVDPGTSKIQPGIYRTDPTADITPVNGFSPNSFEVIVVQIKTDPPIPPLIPPRALDQLRCNPDDIRNFLDVSGNAESI